MKKSEYIISNDSNCKYCYKCLRNCPVKAISFNGENSFVIEEECILCGTCVGICPQNAKNYRKNIDKFLSIIGKPFIISIAPSFYAHFNRPLNLLGLFKKNGCIYISETSVGAEFVNYEYNKKLGYSKKPLITSSCPVVINLVEKYYPKFIDNLIDFASPAIAHFKFLKLKFQNQPKVFIGPCIGKKEELKDYYDLVLTFEEIDSWINQQNFDLTNFKEELPDHPYPERSRFYPISQGVLYSSGNLNFNNIVIEGLDNIINFFKNFDSKDIYSKNLDTENNLSINGKNILIEMSACIGGCLNGPAIRKDKNIVEKKSLIQKYSQILSVYEDKKINVVDYKIDITKKFYKKYDIPYVSEEKINEFLKSLGKVDPSKELNCTACGYDTCREKAKAVILGKAEKDMCFAYLVEKVSSISNKIVDETPNSIIIFNDDKISYLNPATKKLFDGFKYDFILDFCKKVIKENSKINEININGKKLYLYSKVFEIPEDLQKVILSVDLTEIIKQKEMMNKIKFATIEKIEQVLNEQMKLAQNIAGMLGESIAETKSHFSEFKRQMMEDENVDL